MYQSHKIGNDLEYVLETIDELKQAVQQQVKARINLEAENSTLARRLSEALAAERRQRRRAASSRTIAKGAQAALQPVVAVHKELVSLKRELATQKKNFQDEKKILEGQISALQLEITRIKEESEAALAAAAFAEEDADAATFRPAQNAIQVRTAANPRTESFTMTAAPPVPWPYPSAPHPSLSPQLRNGNSPWTGTGQLTWNPPPVNLASKTIDRRRTQPQHRSGTRRTLPTPAPRPQYQPVAGFRTASQLMASHGEEEENEVSNSQVSQSCADNNKQCQTPESDDDCIIVGGDGVVIKKGCSDEETIADGLSEHPIKIEEETPETGTEAEENGLREEPAEIVKSISTESSDATKTPLKRLKKKRRMYMKPSHDDFIE